MQYNKYNCQGGMKLKFFLLQLQRRKKWKLRAMSKMSWIVVPTVFCLKAVHFFLLSPSLWEKGAVSHCLSSLGIVSIIKKSHLHELHTVHKKSCSWFYPLWVCPCFYMLYNHNIFWSSSAIIYLKKNNHTMWALLQ
mgnify:CR=1 FL=1